MFTMEEGERLAILGSVIILIVMFAGIISYVHIYQDNKINYPDYQNNAKVLSKFGCLTTTLTPEEFDAEQKFNSEILGYSYVRC